MIAFKWFVYLHQVFKLFSYYSGSSVISALLNVSCEITLGKLHVSAHRLTCRRSREIGARQQRTHAPYTYPSLPTLNVAATNIETPL